MDQRRHKIIAGVHIMKRDPKQANSGPFLPTFLLFLLWFLLLFIIKFPSVPSSRLHARNSVFRKISVFGRYSWTPCQQSGCKEVRTRGFHKCSCSTVQCGVIQKMRRETLGCAGEGKEVLMTAVSYRHVSTPSESEKEKTGNGTE